MTFYRTAPTFFFFYSLRRPSGRPDARSDAYKSFFRGLRVEIWAEADARKINRQTSNVWGTRTA